MELLKLANSPYFRNTPVPLSNITSAVSLLGIDGINALISTVAMKSVFKVSPIYLKMFGQLIWSHSIQCAKATQIMAVTQAEDPFTAYLLGLIHDTGRIIVFQCLVNSLKTCSPEFMPGTISFRRQATEHTPSLSAIIASEWKLPDSLFIPLGEQAMGKPPQKMSKMGAMLYEANLVTEAHLLVDAGLLSGEQCRQTLISKGLSEESVNKIFQLIEAAQ